MPDQLYFSPRPVAWKKNSFFLSAQFAVSATAATTYAMHSARVLQAEKYNRPRIPGSLWRSVVTRTAFVFPFSWCSLSLVQASLPSAEEVSRTWRSSETVAQPVSTGGLVFGATSLSSFVFHPLRQVRSKSTGTLYRYTVTTELSVPRIGKISVADGVVWTVGGVKSDVRILHDESVDSTRMKGVMRTLYLRWLPELYKREGIGGLYRDALKMSLSTGIFWGGSISLVSYLLYPAAEEDTLDGSVAAAVRRNFSLYCTGFFAGIVAHNTMQVPFEAIVGKKPRSWGLLHILRSRSLISAHAVGLLVAVLGKERLEGNF